MMILDYISTYQINIPITLFPISPLMATRGDEIWYYSDNNKTDLASLGFLSKSEIKKIIEKLALENKINEINIFKEKINQLQTEIATFCGNLYRMILKNHHPNYYNFRSGKNFYRASQKIKNSETWQSTVNYDEKNQILSIKGGRFSLEKNFSLDGKLQLIKGQMAILIANNFLGDEDMDIENLMVTQAKHENIFYITKIDPGMGFSVGYEYSFGENIIEAMLKDPFVYNIANRERLLSLLEPDTLYHSLWEEDAANQLLLSMNYDENAINALFYSKESEFEKFETLYNIFELTESSIRAQANKDISSEFQLYKENLIQKLLSQQKIYKKAAMKLPGFEYFYINKKFQESDIKDILPDFIKHDSNMTFFSLPNLQIISGMSKSKEDETEANMKLMQKKI